MKSKYIYQKYCLSCGIRFMFAFIAIAYNLSFIDLSLTASEYYVNKNHSDASDTNNGSANAPFMTIQRAANSALAGDIVNVVGPATYDERVTVKTSGTVGNYITFIGRGAPVVRGFNVADKKYIKIISFEITHPNTSYSYAAVHLLRANNCEVLDNNIHHVNAQGINIHHYNAFGNNNIIRDNIIAYVGMCHTNVGKTPGSTAIVVSGTNNLCEYNNISACGDYFVTFGYHNILRNNYLHDIRSEVINPDPHVDGLQQSPTIANIDSRWTLFEKNYCQSNLLQNSHGLLLRNVTVGKTVSDIICRQNVVSYNGSVFAETHVPRLRAYNNTLYRCEEIAKHYYIVSVANDTAASAIETTFLNNLYSHCAYNRGTVYFVETNLLSTFKNDYDLRYMSGTSFNPPEPNGLSSDPLFVEELYLSVASPAVNAGGPQSIALGMGNSTNAVAVIDAGMFCDGWDIVTGDRIIVGTNNAINVTNIDYINNIIYIDKNISWTNGAWVQLEHTKDIGAYGYRREGYMYTVSQPQITQNVDGLKMLSTSVNDPGLVRFIKFFVDGLEVGTSTSPPYSINVDIRKESYVVEARAYAMFADKTLVKKATKVISNKPIPPINLIRP